MCTEPLYALRLKTEYDVKFKRFGKRSSLKVLCAVRDIGEDVSKLNYDKKYYDLLMISCGQCLQCRLLRVKQRSVMCICESLEHKENSFITLTFGYYDVYSHYRHRKKLSYYLSRKKAHFHEWSLETEFFQKFMKRLRSWYYNYQLSNYLISIGRSDLVYKKDGSIKSHIRIPVSERPFLLSDFKPQVIRVMHCGEYGDSKQRPHHHAILFGFQFPDLEVVYEDGKKYYTSKILSNLWPFGIHRIGDCTYNSCAYVSRYVTKKVSGNNQDEYYNGRKPEYVTYSTNPVLGSNYFLKNYKEIVNTQQLSVYADKLYVCSMPKSYDEILRKIDIDCYNDMKEKRVINSKTDLERLFKSKRSIYAKLNSNESICLNVLRKLVRSFENSGSVCYDEYIKKAKAFGLSLQWFDDTSCKTAKKYLDRKNYKSHKSKSSNQKILDNYYKFELSRKRLINSCYDVSLSDDVVKSRVAFYENMPNPYKCLVRGKRLLDDESQFEDSCILYDGSEVLL